jgi:hypothetical protein
MSGLSRRVTRLEQADECCPHCGRPYEGDAVDLTDPREREARVRALVELFRRQAAEAAHEGGAGP